MPPTLQQVQWPNKFMPDMPPHYNGATDPLAFLPGYEEAVLKAGGDDPVMANWLPMALVSVPRMWLLHLPASSVDSWEELRGLFLPITQCRRSRSLWHSLAARKPHPRVATSSHSSARSAPP